MFSCFVCMCLCAQYGCMVPLDLRYVTVLSYRQLWANICGCCESNSSTLEEQALFLSVEPSFLTQEYTLKNIFLRMYSCISCAHLIPKEAKRGRWIPMRCSYKWSWASMWIMATTLGSSVRAAGVFHYWAISAAPLWWHEWECSSLTHIFECFVPR